jgi:UDP-N-acetylmuramyl tripeptide synthase
VSIELPFEDSRRLIGSNLFFASTGAVLEVVGVPADDALLDAWATRVERAVAPLGWEPRQAVARRHAGGASLAIAAPCDQLFTATEINEWALCAALAERAPARRAGLEQALVAQALEAGGDAAAHGSLPVIEESAAFVRFASLASAEARPALRKIVEAAARRQLASLMDETELTLGSGAGGRSFPVAALPSASEVTWDSLHDIPTALVTGSNGKTTTVRLIAACSRAHGWHTGYNCTDGVLLDAQVLAAGDYSGPAGARMVLRDRRAQAAVIETARGGMLRRGIAVSRADVATVTNVSSDHFGEYGIYDLAALTDVKLTVAAAVGPAGRLVLNADDPQLAAPQERLIRRFGRCPPLAWFALHADHPTLSRARGQGSSTCGVRTGRLRLWHLGAEHDLGATAAMPLSMDGAADYNVANLACAALAAASLGIRPATIAGVFARFGSQATDNPGRMMRFLVNGVLVLVDYAHNPEGLSGFLHVAERSRGEHGRLGLLLGQAGNRSNADIEALTRAAADFRPDLVVVKENESQLRGRTAGEVPGIIRAELKRLGFADSAVAVCASEEEAARHALAWARPGDVLALPLHSASARAAVLSLLAS